MVTFKVHGPFRIDYEVHKGGRVLKFDEFWAKESPAAYLADEHGCYVFAVRTSGGGLHPIYVGKASKTSFKNETFNPSNKYKCDNGFRLFAKCTPEMFFVVRSTKKGMRSPILIREIEDFLIQTGAARNPSYLQNVVGTNQPRWRIKGVIRSSVGKRNRAEVLFRDLFDIHD